MSLVNVYAHLISPDKIFYICPNCVSAYKKDGSPTMGAKSIIHIHGNCGDMHNRIEYKQNHCRGTLFSPKHMIAIHITDTTSRMKI